MKLKKISLIILILLVSIVSCKTDDGGLNVTPIEERDRTEQQIEDKALLLEYLSTHYYNSDIFENNTDPSIHDLIITKLEDNETVPDGSTLLNDKKITKTLTYLDTEYEIYILNLNSGGGVNAPKFSDEVRVLYEGALLDELVFDNAVTPVNLDLTTLVAGWKYVLPDFNVAESFNINANGTVDFVNPGLGVMFLPSGLGYFSNPPAGSNIPSYSPLIFKFELLQYFQTDHDNDGIPSYLEDINMDNQFTLTDDNSDTDFLEDYRDNDDDNDGIPTREEITVTTYNKDSRETIEELPLAQNEILVKIVSEEDGTFTGTVITFTDTDGDTIPDYRDID